MPQRPAILGRHSRPSTLRQSSGQALLRAGSGGNPGSLDSRPSAAKRGYGRRWQRLRKMVLSAEPLCRECQKRNRLTPATEVDHILPLSKGGANSFENLRALCKPHHSQITREGNRR
jgi:hypothetical protein